MTDSGPISSSTPRRRRHPWLVGWILVALVPAVLAVDLAVALARGWQTSSSMPDVVFAVCGSILVAAIMAALTARGRRFLAERRAPLFGLLISTTVAWTAAEWVCGRVFGGQLLFHRHVPHTDARFHPAPEVMPGVSGEARYTANSAGVRGPELPEDPGAAGAEILCIGGSTTACLFLDDTETWTHLLADGRPEPRPWVGDVGKSGYGSWHHVRFLSKADDLLDRIDVLVVLVGINDFMRALQQRPIYAPPGVEPLYERSNIFAILHNLYQARKQRKQYMQEFADGSAYVRRRELRRARPVSDQLPDLSPWLDDYRANLEAILDVCDQRGIRPVMATQPVLWSDEPRPEAEALCWLGEVHGGTQLATPRLALGMRMFNDVLRDVCAAREADVVDLSPMNGRLEYFFDDCHFTERGAERVAELMRPILFRDGDATDPARRSRSENGDTRAVPAASKRR